MFIKKIILVTLFLFSIHGLSVEEKKTLPVVKETIKFKELKEFDAFFLIYIAPISFNLKDMLRDYMKFREFECTKYDEILKRATVIKGSSFPKNSKAYEVNKINTNINNIILFYGQNQGAKEEAILNLVKNRKENLQKHIIL